MSGIGVGSAVNVSGDNDALEFALGIPCCFSVSHLRIAITKGVKFGEGISRLLLNKSEGVEKLLDGEGLVCVCHESTIGPRGGLGQGLVASASSGPNRTFERLRSALDALNAALLDIIESVKFAVGELPHRSAWRI